MFLFKAFRRRSKSPKVTPLNIANLLRISGVPMSTMSNVQISTQRSTQLFGPAAIVTGAGLAAHNLLWISFTQKPKTATGQAVVRTQHGEEGVLMYCNPSWR